MRTFLAGVLFLSGMTPLPSQETGFGPFLGRWKGVCGDGKDFVVIAFRMAADGSLAGAIQLANMRGEEDGRCAAVVDPPDDKHALEISGAKRDGAALHFRDGKRMDFEMSLPEGGTARLKMMGTASEDHPWKLIRARE